MYRENPRKHENADFSFADTPIPKWVSYATKKFMSSRRRREKDNIADDASNGSDSISEDGKEAVKSTGRIVYSTEKKESQPIHPKPKSDKVTKGKKEGIDPTVVPKGSFFLHDNRDGGRQRGAGGGGFGKSQPPNNKSNRKSGPPAR